MHPRLPRLRTLLLTKPGDVSRAQRSAAALSSIATEGDPRCAAEPGPFQSVAVPDQRCTTRARTDATLGDSLRALALHRIRDTLLVTTALIALGAAPAAAGPDGANVVGGAATIQGQGGPSVIINQSTPSAIINWRTFNIGVGENVRFNQPSSSSVALNRVTGGLGPSEILGTLTANGRVFIINRDGVLFGPGAVVNTAGFLATTSDIKNSDFMAGRYNFKIVCPYILI